MVISILLTPMLQIYNFQKKVRYEKFNRLDSGVLLPASLYCRGVFWQKKKSLNVVKMLIIICEYQGRQEHPAKHIQVKQL